MKGKPAIAAARSPHWNTGDALLALVREVLDGVIELDPCGNQFSRVNANTEFRLPEGRWKAGQQTNEGGRIVIYGDGLALPWDAKTIFVNSPFGHDKERGTSVYDWTVACHNAHVTYGSGVICIQVASTETKSVQFLLSRASAYCLPAARVKFRSNPWTPQQEDAPTKGHILGYWGTDAARFCRVFGRMGFCSING